MSSSHTAACQAAGRNESSNAALVNSQKTTTLPPQAAITGANQIEREWSGNEQNT